MSMYVENAIFCNPDLFDSSTHKTSCSFLANMQVYLASQGFVEGETIQFLTHAYTEFVKGSLTISVSTYIGNYAMIVISVITTDRSVADGAVNNFRIWSREETIQGDIPPAQFADYERKLVSTMKDLQTIVEQFSPIVDKPGVANPEGSNIPVAANTEFLEADTRLKKYRPVLSKHDLPIMTQFIYQNDEPITIANSTLVEKNTRFAVDMTPEADKYYVAVAGVKRLLVVSSVEATKLCANAQQVR